MMEQPEATEADLARWARWEDLRTRQAAAANDAEREALEDEENALRAEGMKELFFQEIQDDPTWWWLSFTDGSLPEGEQFLGVAIVPGSGVMSAALMARQFGCNPGGGIQAVQIPPEHVPDAEHRCRLLSKEQLEKAGLT